MAMTRLAHIGAATLMVFLSACSALTPPPEQAAQLVPLPHRAASTQHTSVKKVEPSQQELFDYVRGKLLALSPSDGFNDNQEVSFDPATSVLSITQPDGRCDIFLGAIDTNSMIWEDFDPSDTYHTREDVLRLTLTALNGKKARTCYDSHNQVDTSIASNRARLLFSVAKTNTVPKFTDNMGNAVKKLVALAGGAPEKNLF
jgi:hypothetical protein